MRTDGLDRSRIRFVDVAGVSTRIYEAGAGEPLVLIHGGRFGTLYSLDAWSLNLPVLAEHFRVVAFDKLGQGHTGNPLDGDYSFAALHTHAAGLLRLLELGPCHLVGHSLGGLLATRIALDQADLVRTLVIVDSATTAPDAPGFVATDFYAELQRRMPPWPPSLESVTIEPLAQAHDAGQVTDDFAARLLEIALLPKLADAQATGPPGSPGSFAALQPLRARTLAEIEERGLPRTLVVWGREDRSAPYRLAFPLLELIAARTEDVAFRLLPGAGHYCFRDRPELFERALRSFCLGDRSSSSTTT